MVCRKRNLASRWANTPVPAVHFENCPPKNWRTVGGVVVGDLGFSLRGVVLCRPALRFGASLAGSTALVPSFRLVPRRHGALVRPASY